MNPVGLTVIVKATDRRTGAALVCHGIIRDDTGPSFIVELTDGPENGRLVALPKDRCRNLGEIES